MFFSVAFLKSIQVPRCKKDGFAIKRNSEPIRE